ncbi:gag-pol polyprotein [Tanacetum coccineum]
MRFADVWLFNTGATFYMTARREWFLQYKLISRGGTVYSCNDNKLKIIGIGSIMVKMHGGTGRTIRDVRHVEGLKKNLLSLGQLDDLGCKLKGEIMEEAEASVASHSPSYRVVVTWHQKLGHMSEQGMKILIERKLLPGLTKNGVAERMNRTLLERARVMLATASLENHSGQKQSIPHVISHVYVMYNTQETTKLDPKSRKCLFLGYAGGIKGYHLWELTSHKVVISRDVIFMEDKIQENEEGEPLTLQEALNNPDASFWKEARQEEIKALHKNKTWELVPLPGVVLAMCATYDLHLEQLDVKTAFLHGNLEEEMYMLQPEGFEQKGKENLVCRPNKDRINKLKAQLAREFKMKDLGPANKILGMFNMQDCKTILTPFPTNVKLSFKMSPSSEKERMKMSRVPYASAIRSLMFVMICTRPDITHAVGVASQYMAELGREHWEAVKRILRYIKGTSDVALFLGDSDLIVNGYVNSDYTGDLDRSKSTIGYVFTLSGETVSWGSKLQSVVAMSTTEAKYVAAAQASKEAKIPVLDKKYPLGVFWSKVDSIPKLVMLECSTALPALMVDMFMMLREDFCLITSFHFGKVEIDPKEEDHSEFRNRVFLRVSNLKGEHLLNLINKDVKFNKLDDEDDVHVCLLLALDYVFMGQELRHVITNSIVNLVDDFYKWDAFPWGEYIWSFFHERVYNVAVDRRKFHLDKLASNPKYKANYVLHGFVFPLKIEVRHEVRVRTEVSRVVDKEEVHVRAVDKEDVRTRAVDGEDI